MHISGISACLLAISASHGALAAPRVRNHALASRGIVKRTDDPQMNGQQASGRQMGDPNSGLCYCPCAQDNQSNKDGVNNGGYTGEYTNSGEDGGMYGGKYDKKQQEADNYLKDKYMQLVKKNQQNYDAKKQARQEEMQKKYSDQTVIIEVISVVVEIDGSGKEMPQRYAMSKWMANMGREKTATCHMTAETMTIGAGSCDNGAASAGAAAATAGYGKDMKMGGQDIKMDGYGNGGTDSYAYSYADTTTSSYYAATSTYSDATYTSASAMTSNGADQMGKDMGKDQKYEKEQKEGMPKDSGADMGMKMGSGDKGKDQKDEKERKEGMPKDSGAGMDVKMDSVDKGKEQKEQKEGMPKDSRADMSNDNSMSKDESKKSSDPSMMPEDAPKPDSTKSQDSKPMFVRRQIGGTVSVIMAPFMGMNETMLLPASMGPPQPQPGVDLVEDPAKDVGKDGWISGCGM